MIIGHCPYCEQPIMVLGRLVQSCEHTSLLAMWLAWLHEQCLRRDDIVQGGSDV